MLQPVVRASSPGHHPPPPPPPPQSILVLFLLVGPIEGVLRLHRCCDSLYTRKIVVMRQESALKPVTLVRTFATALKSESNSGTLHTGPGRRPQTLLQTMLSAVKASWCATLCRFSPIRCELSCSVPYSRSSGLSVRQDSRYTPTPLDPNSYPPDLLAPLRL